MKKMKLNPKGQRIHEVLKCPIVSEKSTRALEQNRYSFLVAVDATKHEIKESVKNFFKVDVEKVNVINREGKIKRFRGKLGKKASTKRAVVRLAKGQTIDIGAKL